MRCDWPAGFNEDCADPACEIYLQLFIENPDIAGDILLPDDDSTGYNQLVPAFIAVDPEQDEDFFMNFQADEVSDIQSLNGDLCMNIVSVTSDNSSESSDSYSDTQEHFSGVVPQHEEISDSEYAVSVLSNSVSEVSVCEAENQDELNGAELHCKETSSKLSDEETSRDTWLPNDILDREVFYVDESDVYSELECLSSDSPSSECFDEALSNDAEESTDICDTVPLSSELPSVTESSREIESSSDNIRTSTHVSLLVVVPPTNFSNEISDNLLSTHSPDHLFAELLPQDAPCSAELLDSCKEDVQDRNSQELCMCKSNRFGKSNHTTSSSSDCQNPDTVLLPKVTDISSDCEVSSLLSECSVLYEMGFDDLGHKSNESENSVLSVESEACYEFTADESVLSKKRKVSSSSDDDVINKVPRYSANTSTDSVNVQEKVENYCKALSCDSDKQISSDGNVSDILPTAASDDNVILTLGKAVEDSAVGNEKPKSR